MASSAAASSAAFSTGRQRPAILIANPNTSVHMTAGMEKAVKALELTGIDTFTYTAPASSGGPASINDEKDIQASFDATHSELLEACQSGDYDAVLIACFSNHPLVSSLQQQQLPSQTAVLGIFEASVLAAYSLTWAIPDATKDSTGRWGIVSTGSFWEEHLASGVRSLLAGVSGRFAGVFTTGLNAGDFHSGKYTQEEVDRRMRGATKRLLEAEGGVSCVVMGCAGMAGLENIIRSAAFEVYGNDMGGKVFIIDAVVAGVLQLQQVVQMKSLFR